MITTTKRVILSYYRQTEAWRMQGNVLWQINQTWIRHFRKHNLTRALEIESELKPIDLRYFVHENEQFKIGADNMPIMKPFMEHEDYLKEIGKILDVEVKTTML